MVIISIGLFEFIQYSPIPVVSNIIGDTTETKRPAFQFFLPDVLRLFKCHCDFELQFVMNDAWEERWTLNSLSLFE